MNLVKDLYFSLIFLADQKYNKNPYWIEKIIAGLKVMAAFAPVAFVLNVIHLWFANNRAFVAGFLVLVAFNAYWGIKKHKKRKTYHVQTFLQKTREMLVIVISVYIVLSIVGNFAGDNLVTECFQVFVQVMTLLLPGGKALKSMFEYSGGEYPPKWIMKRLYKFEEEGDMHQFFKTKKEEDFTESTNEEEPKL